jgi:hypothetical protein
VKKLTLNPGLARTAFDYGIDILSAVPVARIAKEEFQKQFWPDVLSRLAAKHARFATNDARRAESRSRSNTKKV